MSSSKDEDMFLLVGLVFQQVLNPPKERLVPNRESGPIYPTGVRTKETDSMTDLGLETKPATKGKVKLGCPSESKANLELVRIMELKLAPKMGDTSL